MKLFEVKPSMYGFELHQTHFLSNGDILPLSETNHVKTWAKLPTDEEVDHEIMLNDWSRWNTSLLPGQKIEISEAIYDHLLGCLPPHIWIKDYFEVGEPHHYDEKGTPIHRACWIEDNKYYTGYPKQLLTV